jgi:hypothetical protein
MQLAGRDLIALDRVRLSVKRAHVFDEAAGDSGRQFYEYWHGPDTGAAADNCEARTVFGVILLRARFPARLRNKLNMSPRT